MDNKRFEWKRQNKVIKTHESAMHKLKGEDAVFDDDDKKLRQKEEELYQKAQEVQRSLSAIRIKREEINVKHCDIDRTIEFEEELMADAELRNIELENELGLQKVRTNRFESTCTGIKMWKVVQSPLKIAPKNISMNFSRSSNLMTLTFAVLEIFILSRGATTFKLNG